MSCLENKTILAIDDTAAIRTFLRISLMDQGVNFVEASSALEGLRMLEQHKPDVVVLDLGLPDRDGLDILPEIKRSHEGNAPIVVVLTVRNDRRTKDTAAKRGADAYMTKPFEMEDLVEVLQNQLR